MNATLTTARQVFEEQIAAFEQRLELVGTQRYDDLRAEEHYRAFTVAGAMKADLLADLREAVRKAVVDGGTIQDFRKDFDQIVERHGWTGWTGEGTRLGEAWRTRVIYQTNTRKSYSAGRYAQLTDPKMLAVRPYWRWVHSGLARDPRQEHKAWHGMTLHHSDPFWQTYFPPRIPPDYGCGCRVVATRAPAADAQTTAPAGWDATADPGAGAPPQDVVADIQSFVAEKRNKLPPELARPFGEEVERHNIDLLSAKAQRRAAVAPPTPTAVPPTPAAPPATLQPASLTTAARNLLGTTANSIAPTLPARPQLAPGTTGPTLEDLSQLPRILRDGEIWAVPPALRYVLTTIDGWDYLAEINIGSGDAAELVSLAVGLNLQPPPGATRLR